MATKLPHVTITEIPNTSPGATPSLWNTRYYEINENFDALSSYSPVGDCSTTAGTAAKAVTITNFELSKNAFVFVKFSAANTAANPTLNVTGTGAKAIYYQGAAVPASYLEANRYYHFVYDGSHWVLTGDVDVRFRYLPLTGGTLTGDLTVNTNLTVKRTTSLQAVTANKALTAKAGITSNTLTVTGATTLEGALAAQGGISTTTITATGTTTLAGLNASNIKASGTLTVNGSTTLKALGATNITASGTLAVSGATTLTGKLNANGGVTTKALTATSLDLNGNGDVSGTFVVGGKLTANGGLDTKALTATSFNVTGNASVGGLLAVTGDVRASSNIDTRNGYGRGLRLIDTALDALELPSGQRQDWAVRVLDRDERTMAMLKYNKGTDGATSLILAEVTYTSEGTQDWAQLQIGHRADGTRFIDAQAPFRASSTANFLNGLTVSGAKATFNHDIEANGALNVTKTLTAEGNITAEGVISAGRFGVNASGNVFRTNISGLTKGTNPSSQVSAYLGFFDQNGISGAANGLGQISFVYDTDGGTSMRISSYKSDPSAISTNVFTVGWTGAGSKYVTAQGNFTADSIRSNGSLTAAGSATFLNGASISSGNVVCGDQSMFVGKATVNFAHQDSVIVTDQNPTNEQQRWPLAVYDKNNDALAYCKFTMRTTGTKEWAFCVAHPKSDDSGNALGGLIVTCDANGKYGTTGVTADASSNSTDLATTFWVRNKDIYKRDSWGRNYADPNDALGRCFDRRHFTNGNSNENACRRSR